MDKVDHQPSNETRHRLRLSVGLPLAFVLPFIVVTMVALLDQERIWPLFLAGRNSVLPFALFMGIISGLIVICFLQLTVRTHLYKYCFYSGHVLCARFVFFLFLGGISQP